MRTAKSQSVEDLVSDEIRRVVAEAVTNGSILSIGDGVAQIMSAHPQCGLSKRQIGDEVIMAAAAAGLAVEIGPPRQAEV